MLKILACTIITISCTAITEEKKSDDDITTIAEFQDYLRRSHSTCSGDDVSTCPEPDRSVCEGNYCYKTCQNSGDCAQDFLCSSEKLCKPRGCIPCIKGPTYPTTEPSLDQEENQDEFVLDASSITTVDEWEEYLRNTDSYCPSGDVSECPRQRKRICLDGKCFKKCDDDSGCADSFTCNFEGLCKPANCTPCIRKTMYPTSAVAPAPYALPVEEDITTEDEFDAYMRKAGNMCPNGDVSECRLQKNRICLAGKCFKQCGDDNDCSDKFMCNFEGLCKPKKCTPCQRATYYPTPQPPSFEIEEDITTEAEFDEYMRKAGNMCPNGDVSECKRQKDRICLAGKCFKQCGDDSDCSDKFMCNFEGLCKPKKCTPCQRATYYPTPQPPAYDEDITTEDEFDEYMRKSGNMCPTGDVSECRLQRNRICLAGKCFKQCLEDSDCSDKFMCNFEGLCKPKKCTPCQRATYYPTPQPPSFEEDITTEEEFDAYMRNFGNMCPSGDVSECARQKDRICLQGKCFKQCLEDSDCSDKFMCNFENLCKPKKCTPCQRATYYPTPQPPSEYDEIMAVIDGVKFEEEGQHQIFSTSMMIKMTSLVCVIIMIFWICGGCMLWNNGEDKKIAEPSTKYGATGTSSV